MNVGAYLLDTWHPSTRPVQIEAPEAGLKWLGLTVREVRLQDDASGTVSFVARYKLGGRAARMEEVSRFVREEGRWYYVDALPQG
jgi:SEC-C motif domain protein